MKNQKLETGQYYIDNETKKVYMYDGEENGFYRFLENASRAEGKIYFKGSPLLLDKNEIKTMFRTGYENQPKHTQGEWKHHRDMFLINTIRSQDGLLIAEVNNHIESEDVAKANAQLIVKAVNMHNELIKGLKEIQIISDMDKSTISLQRIRDRASELLKQAELK